MQAISEEECITRYIMITRPEIGSEHVPVLVRGSPSEDEGGGKGEYPPICRLSSLGGVVIRSTAVHRSFRTLFTTSVLVGQ
jgi:hypothetical protein